jgi:dsDNA-specific endonuclease/ATPase MutS2
MNLDQLLDRVLKYVGDETQFEKEKRELGLPIIKSVRAPQNEAEFFEFVSMLTVVDDCKRKLESGEDIPEDLTDAIFEARAQFKEIYDSGKIPILDMKKLKEDAESGSGEDQLMSNAILAEIQHGRKTGEQNG